MLFNIISGIFLLCLILTVFICFIKLLKDGNEFIWFIFGSFLFMFISYCMAHFICDILIPYLRK